MLDTRYWMLDARYWAGIPAHGAGEPLNPEELQIMFSDFIKNRRKIKEKVA